MSENLILKCEAVGPFFKGGGQVVGTAGSRDDVTLEIAFGSAWTGTAKTIEWHDALGETADTTILTVNLLKPGELETYLVPVPAACKAYAGEMFLTIRGVETQGGTASRVAVTATAIFRVLPSMYEGKATDISASLAEQLQAEVEAMKATYVGLDEKEAEREAKAEALALWEDYDPNKAYVPGNKVAYNGSSYVCIAECTRISPDDENYWLLIAKKGEDGADGAPGQDGKDGAVVEAEGLYGFAVEDGHLNLYYTGEEPPAFAIDQKGHLTYTLDDDRVVDLGEVRGSGGGGDAASAGRLTTSHKVSRYLTGDQSEERYIDLDGERLLFISATVKKGEDGAALTEPYKDAGGAAQYWAQDITDAEIKDGSPYVDGEQVSMGAEETDWPVLTYQYEETVLRRMDFETDATGTTAADNFFSTSGTLATAETDEGLATTFTAKGGKTASIRYGKDGYIDVTARRADVTIDSKNKTFLVQPEGDDQPIIAISYEEEDDDSLKLTWPDGKSFKVVRT